jgi:hypothetical protein
MDQNLYIPEKWVFTSRRLASDQSCGQWSKGGEIGTTEHFDFDALYRHKTVFFCWV